jgi:hypothetical protein
MFQASTTEVMKLQINKELLKEIKAKIARDLVIQDIITKLQNGE